MMPLAQGFDFFMAEVCWVSVANVAVCTIRAIHLLSPSPLHNIPQARCSCSLQGPKKVMVMTPFLQNYRAIYLAVKRAREFFSSACLR
jgi:hypothetical protein